MKEKKVQKPQTLRAVDKRWTGNGEVEKSANEAVGGAATKLYMMKRKRGWVFIQGKICGEMTTLTLREST